MKHIAHLASGLVTTALLAAAGPVSALSCLRPDPARSFQAASGASEVYVVLRGSFAFDAALMPDAAGMGAPDTLPAIPALFEGHGLGPDGFTLPYRTELLLQPECAGPWCGSMAPTDDAIAFARDNGAGIYVIDMGPCPMWVFDKPASATVQVITACMAGDACEPAR